MYATPTGPPLRFAADWHPSLGPVLQFFPRQLAVRGCELWPDFATLLEDGAAAVMQYHPRRPSRLSACVTYRYQTCSWQARIYRDTEMLFQVEGASYTHVMGLFAAAHAPLEPA